MCRTISGDELRADLRESRRPARAPAHGEIDFPDQPDHPGASGAGEPGVCGRDHGEHPVAPGLRYFADRNADRAEDLVQDTVLRALSRREGFEEGTNMQAWLFTILRNSFFTSHRTKGREVEDADGYHAASLITIPDQDDRLAIKDLQVALGQLSSDQRAAIILVGADGLTYEEAAEALECAVGTVKSRVNRAGRPAGSLMGLVEGKRQSRWRKCRRTGASNGPT